MDETEQSQPESEDPLITNYRLYMAAGVVSGFLAWFLIPLLGVVTVFCGYYLYTSEGERLSAGIFVVVGASALISWVIFLAT
mgnify:CR=1 FL=1